MKFLIFLCCAFVFVESFPLEEFEDFEGHDVAVEIQTNESEHEPLVRIKRQFSPFQPGSSPFQPGSSPFQPGSSPFQRSPSPTFSYVPPRYIPPPPNPWSGNLIGGGSTVGGRLNYDVPRGGASVMGAHTFGGNPNTRVGVEGRLNLINDRVQRLQLNAGHMTNLGPGPRMPQNTVGLSYQRSFG